MAYKKFRIDVTNRKGKVVEDANVEYRIVAGEIDLGTIEDAYGDDIDIDEKETAMIFQIIAERIEEEREHEPHCTPTHPTGR